MAVNLKGMQEISDKIIQQYKDKNGEVQQYLADIKQIVIDSKAVLEGNYFYRHTTLEIQDEKILKQINIFWCGMQAKTRICEIGFNAGHSTMLMLLGRERTPLDFTIFDIGHHAYTKPAFHYIQGKFPHVKFEFIEGDSTITMIDWIQNNKSLIGTYDIIHVDGGHSEHCITNDMKHSDILISHNGIIVIDDTDVSYINKCVNTYISSGRYIELNVLKQTKHRIIRKL